MTSSETDLEIISRKTETDTFYFLINFSGKDVSIPTEFINETDLLTNEILSAETIFKPYDVRIIKK